MLLLCKLKEIPSNAAPTQRPNAQTQRPNLLTSRQAAVAHAEQDLNLRVTNQLNMRVCVCVKIGEVSVAGGFRFGLRFNQAKRVLCYFDK